MSARGSGAITALEVLEGVFSWGLRIAALLIVAITGYYIYAALQQGPALFGGRGPTGPLSPQEFQRHVGNVTLLTQLLLVASVVVAVCAIGKYYAHAETGLALAVVGAALFFGIPMLLQSGVSAGELPRNLARLGDPRAILMKQYGIAGLILLGAGIADLVVHAAVFMAGFRGRRPKPEAEAAKTAAQVRKANDKFLGYCWNLPFCRDTEKKLCPIRASKKPCWRTGRGCYCDQNIILTLSGGGQYAGSRGSAGYLSRTATVVRPKTLSEKRAQCLACPVYLHHQQQKYSILAPLSIAAVIGALVFYWGTVSGLYPKTILFLGRTFSGFSFGSSVNGMPDWAADLAKQQGLMWLIVIVSTVLAISYLLQAVEWTLYRLGI